MEKTEYRVRSAEYGVRSAEYGVRSGTPYSVLLHKTKWLEISHYPGHVLRGIHDSRAWKSVSLSVCL